MELFVPESWADEFVTADDMERDVRMMTLAAVCGCDVHKHSGHSGDRGYLYKKA
jgi:hypothetical protein